MWGGGGGGGGGGLSSLSRTSANLLHNYETVGRMYKRLGFFLQLFLTT